MTTPTTNATENTTPTEVRTISFSTAGGADKKFGGRTTTGSLERKPNGTYLIRWMINGQRYSKASGTSDRRKALEIMNAMLAGIVRDGHTRRVETMIARFDGTLQEQSLAGLEGTYFASPRHPKYSAGREAEVRGYIRKASAWLQAHGCQIMADVTEHWAKQYSEQLLAEMSQNTACRHTATLDAVWKVVLNIDDGGSSVWHKLLQRDSAKSVGHRALTDEEVAEVVRLADAKGPEYGLLFRIGRDTGLRLCDCATLDWSEVNLGLRTMTVTPDKTKRYGTTVTVPMSDEIAEAMEKVNRADRHGPVMPEVNDKYRTHRRHLCDDIQGILQAAGIKTQVEGSAARRGCVAGFHSLRHYFVTRCANAGVPLAVVGGIVGHRSTRMTSVYAHQNATGVEQVRRALRKPCEDCPKTDAEVEEIARKLMEELSAEQRAKLVKLLQ